MCWLTDPTMTRLPITAGVVSIFAVPDTSVDHFCRPVMTLMASTSLGVGEVDDSVHQVDGPGDRGSGVEAPCRVEIVGREESQMVVEGMIIELAARVGRPPRYWLQELVTYSVGHVAGCD